MTILSWHIPAELAALVVFLIVTSAALLVRHLALRALRKWSSTRNATTEHIVWRALHGPSIVWCILLGMYSALASAKLPGEVRPLVLNAIHVLLVLSVTAAAASLARATLMNTLRKHNLAIPATGLSLTAITVVIWIVGGLIVLSGLGVAITPILTALGVGGLAVALALQDTLSNFFAGIHLLLEKPLRVGDFVKLESGQEGYVEDIGWRTTRIRMLSNNTVIIPNNKITQSVLTNYYLPEPRMGISISVRVSYDADPARVEQILLDEATKTVGQVPGLLGQPPPAVKLIPGFGSSSLELSLDCHVREFTDQYMVQHELRKRIFKRFKQEGIDIPYPQQTVYVRQDSEQPSGSH